MQCLAESLKEKVARGHQQQDLERANYERRIDELEKDKEKALRVQALQNAGTAGPASVSCPSACSVVSHLGCIFLSIFICILRSMSVCPKSVPSVSLT